MKTIGTAVAYVPARAASKNGQTVVPAYHGDMATKTKAHPTRDGSRAAVVTEGAVQAALRRGPARELAPEEEKVMRMRLGAAPPRAAPLERVAESLTDLEIEVYAVEIEAYLRWKARSEERAPDVRPAGPRPTSSRTKEKIVRALRRKT
jgi:hypothetical protein